MSINLVEMATQALLSQAAYAEFPSLVNLEAIEAALREQGVGDFSEMQARQFLGMDGADDEIGFELRHHLPNQSSGFSASVFWDRTESRYVLSIRGTEGATDIVDDLRIFSPGYAAEQLVSLYRYYRQLITPAGQRVEYSTAEIAQLAALRFGALPPLLVPIVAARTAAQLSGDYGILPLVGASTTVIPADAPLIVTGHSLGGHLAILFGRMFPQVTEHVYTYNAPGTRFFGEKLLQLLGVSPIDPSRVTNAISNYDPVSQIQTVGERVLIGTEPGSAVYNHSIVPLTDALALYQAIATISPDLSSDAAAIGRLISAFSLRPESSLELALDGLRRTLGIEGSPTQIAATLTDLAQRDDYYGNIHALLDSRVEGRDYRILSLVGMAPSEIARRADSDVSVRYALSELLPFAARNADFDDFADTHSGAWLASRAEMLSAVIGTNLIDTPYLSPDPSPSESYIFEDRTTEHRVPMLKASDLLLVQQYLISSGATGLQDFLDSLSYTRSIVFGSDDTEGEVIVGLAGADRLFGGAHDDYLEGGSGADYLEGGDGDDELFGGADDDILNGGGGNDWLAGGAGFDTYRFDGVLDSNTVVDRDGSIIVGASTLRGGVLQEDGTYVGGDAAFWYEFTGELEAGGTLVINGTLRVEGFRNGDLGIKLLDASELPDVPLAPLPSASDGYTGSDAEDVPTEWHDLFGNSVYDLLDGSDMGTDMWGGDDYFILGDGNDIGSGDLGNDLLEGGAGRDFLHGGQGGDALFGVSRELVDGLFAETEGDGSAGDWLVGAEGDDSLYGTSGSDFMHGGIGTDYIAGGAGNDVIHADLVSFESESVPLHTRLYWSQPDLLPGPDGGDFALNHLIVAGVSTTSWPSIFTDIQAPGDILNRLHPSLVGPDAGEAGDADIVVAGPGSDVVYLGGGDDLASGGAGADRIFGGHGADEMLGEGGNDSLEGGAGSDTLFGGGGDDTLRVAAEEGELSLGEEGNDSIYVTEGSPGEVFVDAGAGNDFVRIEFAHATVLGGDGNDVLQTFWGSGVLIGGGGQDTITAEPGSVVDGGAGNDRITARGSQDAPTSVLWGKGHGSDTASLVHTTLLVEGALPHEIVASRSTIEFPGVVMVINGVPITIGGFIAPATQFQLIGDTATITFLDAEYIGDRSLRVAFEDGTIWEEEDIAALLDPPAIEDPSLEIEGSDAEDLLYGSLEADTFRGGAGDDWLIGDQGHDIYHYAEGDGFDIIDDVDATVANSDQVVFASGIETSEVDVFATGSDYILAIGDGGLRLKGARVAEGAIETIRFGDGTQWSSSDLESLATILPDNAAPEMPESFGVFNVDAGSAATIEIPHDAIVDTDQFDSLTYYAITAEGDPLPDWLVFDATALTVAANPEQANAGTHELLIIAADSNGAAAFSELTISVPGGSEETPSGEESSDYTVDAPAIVELLPPNAAVSSNAPTSRSVEQFEGAPSSLSRFDIPPPRVGEPLDPLYREMTARLDVLLQVGRTNLMERYAEAVREFEERRRAREEPPAPPPPTEQEIMEWNQAMHAWHERHPGFTDVDGTERDGVWTVGWGAGGGEVGFSELLNIGGTPSLANPAALPRLPGAARAPGLTEGFRETR